MGKVNNDIVHGLILDMFQKELVYDKSWGNYKFARAKLASATEKSDIGEDILKCLLEKLGIGVVTMPGGRRGEYDVAFEANAVEVRFEVKVATQDTNGSFQFNGIRRETNWTHLFCFGIAPNGARYKIIEQKDTMGSSKKYNLVPMAKGTNATFKLTQKWDDLIDFDNFEKEIKDLMGV